MQTNFKLEPFKDRANTFLWNSEDLKVTFDFNDSMPIDVELLIDGVTGLDVKEAFKSISGEEVEIPLSYLVDGDLDELFQEIFIHTHYSEVLADFLSDYYNNLGIFLKQNFEDLPDSKRDFNNSEELLETIFPNGSNIDYEWLVTKG